MLRCKDCKAVNRSFNEYCVRCGAKLTQSHRKLHSNAIQSSFILDELRSHTA